MQQAELGLPTNKVSRMLLKRRKPPNWLESLRVWVWPRRSWLRSSQYVTKRILRLTASPHAIAGGVAVGAFTSFTPFMGLHFLFAAILAWLIRGNLLASALGTFVGNPLTFPLIWAAAYNTGNYLLSGVHQSAEPPALTEAMGNVLSAIGDFDGAAALTALDNIWTPILYPMLIGGSLIGLLVALPIYFLTRRAAVLFRESRRNKLIAKAAEMRDRAKELSGRSELPSGTQQT